MVLLVDFFCLIKKQAGKSIPFWSMSGYLLPLKSTKRQPGKKRSQQVSL